MSSQPSTPQQLPLGCALIGAGRMAGVHAQVLKTISAVKILWVVDVNAGMAQQLAESLGAQGSSDLDAVLADPNVRAVMITTPAGSHAELIRRAAAAGKAIFTEKPLAQNLRDAVEAVIAVEAAGVPNQIGFQRRYDPGYAEAKRRIDAGELGKLEGFRGVGRDPEPPPTSYLVGAGGLLVDMGGHDLDLARFLVGEVEEVQAIGGAIAKPELAEHGEHDTAVALLKFENGAVGTLEVALRTTYGYDIRTEVLGEKGRLHIERDRKYDLMVYGTHGMNHDRPRHFSERFAEAYAAEITAFAKAIVEGTTPAPSVREGLYTLRLAMAAQHALNTGEKVRVADYGKEEMSLLETGGQG